MMQSVITVAESWNRVGNAQTTINTQLAISLVQKHHTYCVVLETSKEQIADAAAHGVDLVTPSLADGLLDALGNQEQTSSFHWLYFPENYYTSLPKIKNVGAIIVHCPGTYQAAFAMKKLFPDAKIILINHAPSKPDDETTHLKCMKYIDTVFSVGPKVFSHYEKIYRARPITHELYLPRPDQVYFDLDIDVSTLEEKKNKQILMNAVSRSDEDLSNRMIGSALDKAADLFEKMNIDVLVWCVRRSPELSSNEIKSALKTHIKESQLDPNVYSPYGSQDELFSDLRQSYVFIARPDEPYGIEGLPAICAGLPVIVPKTSGLAYFLKEYFAECVDYFLYDDTSSSSKELSDLIIKITRHPTVVAKKMKELRGLFKKNNFITKTHEKFIDCCQVRQPIKPEIRKPAIGETSRLPTPSTSGESYDESDGPEDFSALQKASSRKRKREQQFPSFQATANLDFEEKRLAVEEKRVKMECTRDESRISVEERQVKLELLKEDEKTKRRKEELELEDREAVIKSKKRRLEEARMLYDMEKDDILERNEPDKIYQLKQAFREYNMTVKEIQEGSLKFTLSCESVRDMEHFWQEYESGHVARKLASILVTPKMEDLADGAGKIAKIKLDIDKSDYERIIAELGQTHKHHCNMAEPVTPTRGLQSPKKFTSPTFVTNRAPLDDIKNVNQLVPT